MKFLIEPQINLGLYLEMSFFALGIEVTSFFVFHKKDTTDSPPERPNNFSN